MNNVRNYFDAHFHLFDNTKLGNQLANNIGELADKNFFFDKYFNKGHVIGGIVMGNGALEQQGVDLPDNVYYCLGIDEDKDIKIFESALNVVEDHLQRKKCVGVKLYPGYVPRYPNDEIYYPLFKLLCKYNKVLAVHTGMIAGLKGKIKYTKPIYLDDIAVDFPELRIVMCHFGNPFLAEAAAVLEHNPNVYADLSGLIEGRFNAQSFCQFEERYINELKTWIQYIGSYDKYMFGTDWPAVNGEEYYKFIASLFSDDVIDNIMYKNALRIYRIKEIN